MSKLQEEILIGIGDLHGHYPALERLERELDEFYNIFDGNPVLRKNARVVFTGDYIDRGEYSLQVIEEVRRLQEANKDNIFALMGNHELLALEGFDDAVKINELVKRAELSIGRSYSTYADRTVHGMNGGAETIQSFGKLDAFNNYVKRMSRDDGDVRQWMKKLYTFAVLDFLDKRVLFVHADVPEHLHYLQDVEDYRRLFQEHLADKTDPRIGSSKKYNHELVRKSLFWERVFSTYTEDRIHSVADHLGMDFIVTGHTPHKGRIVSYFDRVFDIDVGMCPRYGENAPAAIVFKKDGIYEFYCSVGERKLVDFNEGLT